MTSESPLNHYAFSDAHAHIISFASTFVQREISPTMQLAEEFPPLALPPTQNTRLHRFITNRYAPALRLHRHHPSSDHVIMYTIFHLPCQIHNHKLNQFSCRNSISLTGSILEYDWQFNYISLMKISSFTQPGPRCKPICLYLIWNTGMWMFIFHSNTSNHGLIRVWQCLTLFRRGYIICVWYKVTWMAPGKYYVIEIFSWSNARKMKHVKCERENHPGFSHHGDGVALIPMA